LFCRFDINNNLRIVWVKKKFPAKRFMSCVEMKLQKAANMRNVLVKEKIKTAIQNGNFLYIIVYEFYGRKQTYIYCPAII
jgi:hypothetical protein